MVSLDYGSTILISMVAGQLQVRVEVYMERKVLEQGKNDWKTDDADCG